ncbi:MAG: hypothetical protein A3A61_03230 [Candidatus Woykebacteria bacterium RIFCSPLOWO2_01_FULL_43_14]|uniref:histidine kinase n=1 Tax=Candidatus Woykebacteria bacterium RIFCSPLOWO2_01_FULL_43_14 TaxID=1802605 RepID=A0A1G1WZM5_9BACT|nr:MAG: hypothetical protein A3A61_03230 [Candidatus Woykebacteria bacterium RIFCSPLOWO2_01_FULL_43_14]
MWLIRKFSFPKNSAQFLYSLLLIVLIPAILAFNTLTITTKVDRDMNAQIRSTAALVGNTISPSIDALIANPEKLESQLVSIVHNTQEEIKSISVLKIDGETGVFTTYATTDQSNAQNDESLITNQIAWGKDETYASQILSVTGEKLWTVVSPVKNLDGKKIALLNVKVSTKTAEALIARTIKDSLIIMVGTIFLVLLLLLNHIRFFETSVLFSRLKEVNKLKDVFISVASHELLSPMTAIKGYLELLKSSPLPQTKEIQENIKFLSENFDRLQQLVMDLLDVSRIENNKIIMNLQPINLEDLIKDSLTEFAILAKEKNLTLSYDLPLSQPIIMGDERRLRQVLTNIVSNAIKYTIRGGLSITHEFSPDKITTHFKDTGLGIAEGEVKNLFQKFYRVRTKDTETIPGTGLGLWLIKEFVDRMNGKIYVQSIEHSGTQVTVELPINKVKP